MDSLTQIVLGASVGELVCGKKAGNKALLWGAIAGTIPDLDVLASPFQDMVEQLTFHRSVTHSILFCIGMSPVFGWLVHKLYRNGQATFKDWSWLFFWGFLTHIILDSFTTWGTQIFWPFSTYPVAFHNIFVIDPLYTVPFLICTIAVIFYKRTDNKRRTWNYTGLALSSAYMLLTIVNKFIATSHFEEALQQQNKKYQRISTRPTPFNSILWSANAEGDSLYYVGYYSLFDTDQSISFQRFPKKHELLKPYLSNPDLQTLLKVTTGFYTVEKTDTAYTINDLRFGQLDGWGDGNEGFVFAYIMKPEGDSLIFTQKPNDLKKARGLIGQLWERIKGQTGIESVEEEVK